MRLPQPSISTARPEQKYPSPRANTFGWSADAEDRFGPQRLQPLAAVPDQVAWL